MSWTNKSIERYEEQLRERWTPDAKPEPSLQLLVIDIIGTCLVIAERGGIPKSVFRLPGSFLSDFRYYVDDPFDVVKTAIDGEKPYPRIEKITLTHYHYFWMGEYEKGGRSINGAEYDALSKLAGKLLPLYEGGKWDELIALQSKDEYGDWIDKRDFTAWRYTR